MKRFLKLAILAVWAGGMFPARPVCAMMASKPAVPACHMKSMAPDGAGVHRGSPRRGCSEMACCQVRSAARLSHDRVSLSPIEAGFAALGAPASPVPPQSPVASSSATDPPRSSLAFATRCSPRAPPSFPA